MGILSETSGNLGKESPLKKRLKLSNNKSYQTSRGESKIFCVYIDKQSHENNKQAGTHAGI